MSPVELKAANPVADDAKKLTGTKVFLMLLAFFATIIGVNVIMMRYAITTMPGVVTASSYQASQTFNEKVIAAAHEQHDLGWVVEASVSRADKDLGAVAASFKDAKGAPVTGLSVSMKLTHPATTHQDLTLSSRETSQGVYLADVEGLKAGARDLVIEARQGDKIVYRSSNRIIIK